MLPFAPHDTGRDPDPADGPDGFDEVGTVTGPDGARWRVFSGPRHLTFIRSLRLVPVALGRGPTLVPLRIGGFPYDNNEWLVGNETNPATLLKLATERLHPVGSLGRSLFLNADARLRAPGEAASFEIVLSPHGMGWWRNLTAGTVPRHEAAFFWPEVAHERLRTEPAEELLAWLLGLDEETCQIPFARRFLAMSRSEQTALFWQGDTAEIMRVLQLALLALEPKYRREQDRHGLLCRIELDAVGSNINPAFLHGTGGPAAQAELRAVFDLVVARLGFKLIRENLRYPCARKLWTLLCTGTNLRGYLHAPKPRMNLEELGQDDGAVSLTDDAVAARAARAWQAWLDRTATFALDAV